MRLSHTSISIDVSHRVLLISRYPLRRELGDGVRGRCWNARLSQHSQVLDPRALTFSTNDRLTENELLALLETRNLPLPVDLRCVTEGLSTFKWLARFQSASNAALVCSELALGEPLWSFDLAMDYALCADEECPPWPNGPVEQSYGHETQSALVRDRRPSAATLHPGSADTGYWSGSSAGYSARVRSGSSGSGFASSQYGSDASNEGRARTPMSATAGSTSRRRFPRKENHYPCRAADCDKTFDRAGERKKHERIHEPPETWKNQCTECGKRFLESKDLTRHLRTHKGKDASQ